LATGLPCFSIWNAAEALIGIAFVHLGMNLFDDYFDYKNQFSSDAVSVDKQRMVFRKRKCAYLLLEQTTLGQLFAVATLFCGIALILGIVIFFQRGTGILIFTCAGGLLGISYSARPICWGYRGWGEILFGFMFGPLLMSGVFYAACGGYSPAVGFLSLAIGLLVSNILFTHNIMDSHSDVCGGKKTLAVLLRTRKKMLIVSCLFNLTPFLLTGYAIVANYLPLSYCLVFAAIPLSIHLIYLVKAFLYNPDRQFVLRWWMRPAVQWKSIQQAGIDQFMIRWYLSRNINICFCILVMIASLCSEL
jgi:1,4-dihydroxy-2-naphthoate octaprenyltransferase